jgi:hypothetical protein
MTKFWKYFAAFRFEFVIIPSAIYLIDIH